MTSGLSIDSFPHVAIVLVNWNNWQDCIDCIDSLLGMDYPNFHVYVIDNDSGDQSVEKLCAWCQTPMPPPSRKLLPGIRFHTQVTAGEPVFARVVDTLALPLAAPSPDCRLSLIRAGGNLGFAGGCNVGIRSASTDAFNYFWFLNTDTIVDRHALDTLLERARADAGLGMVGSTVLYLDRPDTVQALAGAWFNADNGESRHIGEGTRRADVPADPADVERQLAYIFGASMLVSSTLINRIGLMQEDYFLYYEEMDWAMRSRDHFKFGYAPRSLVYHKSGNSSSKAMPLFTANLFYRNRIRFMSRFFPQFVGATKRGLFTTLLRAVAAGRWAQARLLGRILLEADNIADEAIRSQMRSVLP